MTARRILIFLSFVFRCTQTGTCASPSPPPLLSAVAALRLANNIRFPSEFHYKLLLLLFSILFSAFSIFIFYTPLVTFSTVIAHFLWVFSLTVCISFALSTYSDKLYDCQCSWSLFLSGLNVCRVHRISYSSNDCIACDVRQASSPSAGTAATALAVGWVWWLLGRQPWR